MDPATATSTPAPAPIAVAREAVHKFLTEKKAAPAGEAPKTETPAAPAAAAASTENPPATDGAPKTETPPAPEGDAKSLKTITTLSKENRELKTKLKEFEDGQGDRLAHKEAKELWSKDPVAALGKAFGGDGEAMAVALLKAYVAGGGALPEADAAATDNPLAAEVKALREELDARKKSEKEAAEKVAREAVQKKNDEQVTEIIKGLTDCPLVQRPENRREAILAANAAVIELAEQQGIPLDTKDPEIVSKLFKEAFVIAEAQLREIGKRFALESPPSAEATAAAGDKPKTNPPQTPAKQTPTAKPAASITPIKETMTVEEAKRHASQRLAEMLKANNRR